MVVVIDHPPEVALSPFQEAFLFRICVLFPASGSVSAAVAASLDQGLVDDVEGDADDSLEGQEPDVEADADQSADQFGYHLVSFVKRCSLEIIRICELSNSKRDRLLDLKRPFDC